MPTCFFVSDLHGHVGRYRKLFSAIDRDEPDMVFLGGDLLPPFIDSLRSEAVSGDDFIDGFLKKEFRKLRSGMKGRYPSVFLIPGNDDPRSEEESITQAGSDGLWTNIEGRAVTAGRYAFVGYASVPPTPFRLKDWERYDVSRFVDPGCVPPEEGSFSFPVDKKQIARQTIQEDLDQLTRGIDFSHAVFLFHSPPYDTSLDRAALDGKTVDHAPLDIHVGSIAIRRFLERSQPLLSMHGHVHESVELTGVWREKIGRTYIFGGAHSGPELALVRFTLENPEEASRELF